MLSRTKATDGKDTFTLDNLAADWYGQCWSTKAESDAMWRIYSPDPTNGAVKVRSTIGRLWRNLTAAATSGSFLQTFVGKVDYVDEQAIVSRMRTLTFMDVAIGGQSVGFAELLAIKREAFEHEREVRLLVCDNDQPRLGDSAKGLFTYPLDANAVFEDMVLDPRLEAAEAAALEAELRAAGWRHGVARSELYQVPEFLIPME